MIKWFSRPTKKKIDLIKEDFYERLYETLHCLRPACVVIGLKQPLDSLMPVQEQQRCAQKERFWRCEQPYQDAGLRR